MSIRSTVAKTLQVFPARSWKVKRNVLFPVKIYHVVFSPVICSLKPVIIANTSVFVHAPEAGEYSIIAVGAMVSGSLMMKVAPVLLPARSVTMRIYIPVAVMLSPPVYADPLSVAITHVVLSEKNMLIPV